MGVLLIAAFTVLSKYDIKLSGVKHGHSGAQKERRAAFIMIQPINILTNIYLPKVDQMKIVISEDEAKTRLSSTWTYGLSPRPSQGIKSKQKPFSRRCSIQEKRYS